MQFSDAGDDCEAESIAARPPRRSVFRVMIKDEQITTLYYFIL